MRTWSSFKMLILILALVVGVGLVACTEEESPIDTSPDTQNVLTEADSTETNVPAEETVVQATSEATTAQEETVEAETQAAEDTAESETAADTQAETQAETEAETQAGTQAETQVETEAETQLETQAETQMETQAETQAVTEAETEAETEAVTDVMIGETLDAPYAASFTVSNVFSDDMVVQRGEHIRVWGFAPASENGKKVSGEFKGMFAEAIIENGEWVLTFGARLEASEEMGHSMRIYTDTTSVTFGNVLVGDVYMVIGQSNVAFSMANHWSLTSGKAERSEIDESAPIRIHYNSLGQAAGYPRRGTEDVCLELKNGSRWQKATVANINNFSAIGYLFAYHMMEKVGYDVPVGIIEIDGNGQPLGAFLPNEIAEEKRTDTYNATKGYYVTSGVNADAGRYMYNHYMFPFEKYALAGIIWYQGESDYAAVNAKVFAENFTALMTYMRGTHNVVNKDFPVYIVEFPTNYAKHPDFTPSVSAPQWAAMDVGLIRAVVGGIPRQLPNSYLVVSSDLWLDDTYWNSLHPYCKYEQAERCASIAAALLGKGRKAAATGPVLVSMELSADGKTAVLTYDNVGAGLKTSDGGTSVKGFGFINSGFRINPTVTVTATITARNQVTVTCNRAITGLVYNFVYTNVYGEHVNLCNSFGTPAGANLIFPES